LESLNLAGTRITDATLLGLTDLKKLKELNVSFTEVSDTGVRSFQKALPGCVVKR
ncbi:MAG: hypothetical protein IH790_10450, partial [Acidobacteria bacterium]|nr:hypothetical protein [Acidobacteriota bacterium]